MITCQRARISSERSRASGGALVRQLLPAEEPTESPAKERQCVRRHQSEERRESRYRRETWICGGSAKQRRGLQVDVRFNTPFLSEVGFFFALPRVRLPLNL